MQFRTLTDFDAELLADYMARTAEWRAEVTA
jgi:hypothetical protein